ncbi:oxygenase MpaB family protein [Nevskia ramosa]|uniref:oxygenase MpaB family protein n=1 Tax=Nevskia ramosa TaxID=64002 RepID=UPI0003B6328F|nr:oxygenase MpaB family protein [Nevskia ramosa]
MNPPNRLKQSLLPALSGPVKTRLRNWVIGVFPRNAQLAIEYDQPLGDPGLFGPDSVTWRIHGDFPAMMAGGIGALMLQTLHPAALAGVWDHSNFRHDLIGRLRRTTAFVAGTSYAPTSEAQRLIARVRGIHDRVRGVTEDGQPYEANDPALLTWVHVTEVSSFLRGYLLYADPTLPLAVQDRYYAENAQVAIALGAAEVPTSVAEVAAYFESVQKDLRFSERSREVLTALADMKLPIPMAGVSKHLFLGAGAALLPDWAAARIERSVFQRLRDQAGARSLNALGPLFRAALTDGIAQRACRRVGIDLAALRSFPAMLPPSPARRTPRRKQA